jgi:hypothetical protein
MHYQWRFITMDKAQAIEHYREQMELVRQRRHRLNIYQTEYPHALDAVLAEAIENGLTRRELQAELHGVDCSKILSLGSLLAMDCSQVPMTRLRYLCHMAMEHMVCAHIEVSGHDADEPYEIIDADGQVLKSYYPKMLAFVFIRALTAQLLDARQAQVFRVWCLESLYPEYERRAGKAHANEARMAAIQWGRS